MVESLLPSLLFLSTLPVRGATGRLKHLDAVQIISIHAPREGSDTGCTAGAEHSHNFYPRSP